MASTTLTSRTIRGISYSAGKSFVCAYSATGNGGSEGNSNNAKALTVGNVYYFLGYVVAADSGTTIKYPCKIGSSSSASSAIGYYPESVFPYAKYTVSYNANGGSGAPSSQTKTYGQTLRLSSTKPTRTGYTFLGWSTSSTATSASYSAGGNYTSNSSNTLYAVWKANTLTIKYHINGGTLDSDTYYTSSSLIYLTSSKTVLQDKWTYNGKHANGLYNASTFGLSRTGYNFKGWKVGASGTTVFDQDDASVVPTDLTSVIKTGDCTITLYAVWELKTYTVSYNANGGSGAPSHQTKNYGQTLTLSSTKPTKSGYTFMGWGTSASDTTADYSAGGSYTANSAITLYAVWKKTLTLSYNANGGSGAPSSSSADIYNSTTNKAFTISTAIPTRTGYTFLGWNTSSNATSAIYSGGESLTISANITLYAVWSINSYKLTIYPDGGTWNNTTAISTITQNYATTVSVEDPSWVGHTFSGWTLSGSGTLSGRTYTFGAGAGTLTARWDTNDYVVTLDAGTNGGTVDGLSQSPLIVEYGSAIGNMPSAEQRNYTFLGWFTSPIGGNQITSDYIVTGDITLYAHYEIDATAYTNTGFETEVVCLIDENGVLILNAELEEQTDFISKIDNGVLVLESGSNAQTQANSFVDNEVLVLEYGSSIWEEGVTYVTDIYGNVRKGHAKTNVNGVWKDGFCK